MKIYIYLVGIVLSFLTIYGIAEIPNHYRKQGKNEALQELAIETRKVIQDRNAEIERIKKFHEETNQKTIASYESKLSVLDYKYRIARAPGLRINSNCNQATTRAAEAESTTRNNEAESIRLPARIENGLFDLARKADEVNTQLFACQSWIKENGFN